MLQRPWQARWDWGNPVSHCTSDLPHWAAHPYSRWFSASLLFLAFCQIPGTFWTIPKISQGWMVCVSIFSSTALNVQGLFTWEGGLSIFSREWHLTAVLPEKQSCFGACGTTRSPFTTFAVVLEECVLRPSSCAMENSTSLLVAVSSYAAVWYRRQSERGRERKKAWPLESLQQGYLCRASQFPGPAGISPRE